MPFRKHSGSSVGLSASRLPCVQSACFQGEERRFSCFWLKLSVLFSLTITGRMPLCFTFRNVVASTTLVHKIALSTRKTQVPFQFCPNKNRRLTDGEVKWGLHVHLVYKSLSLKSKVSLFQIE